MTDLLTLLVQTPSVNPMGQNAVGRCYLEEQLTEVLATVFDSLGFSHVRQNVSPGRTNILAKIEGSTPPEQGGMLILFDAHQDTVPIDGMTIEPFGAKIESGRMYGRGACDTKASMAAMIHAMMRLKQDPIESRPTVVLACTINEECGFSGVIELLRDITSLEQNDVKKILPRLPDMVLVGEPTELRPVVAHKGSARWEIHTHGRSAHSSSPEEGKNAIYRMGKIIATLEQYQNQIVPTLAEHPLCGRPTLSVGTIHGGTGVNLVPERCVISIDRRVVPGESPAEAYRHAIDYLKAAGLDEPWIEYTPGTFSTPLTDERSGPVVERLAAATEGIAPVAAPIGVPYGTDASWYADLGVPSVVFGPGSIRQAHTCNEWVEMAQVEQAAEIFYRFLKFSEV
ncbi:MAG: M20 family metallopeptidase [Planctomycetia bacterium]